MDPVAQQNYPFFRALYVWHKSTSHKKFSSLYPDVARWFYTDSFVETE